MGDLGTRSQRLRMVLRRSRNLLRTRMGMASDLEWKRNLLQEGGSRRLPERTQIVPGMYTSDSGNTTNLGNASLL